MGLFDKKDKRAKALEASKKDREKKLNEIKSIIDSAPKVRLKKHAHRVDVGKMKTREYADFLKDTKKARLGFFEKASQFSGKLLPITLSKKDSESIGRDIKTSYLDVTSAGVFAFSILTFLLLALVTVGFMVFTFDMTFTIILFGITVGAWYYVYSYPSRKAKRLTNQMSADSILAILYMIIYMRASPNLEGALKFAAENLGGPLSWDLKKLLWDIEVGIYGNADEAMGVYAEKWKTMNVEFSESLGLLRGVAVKPERRTKLFDETLEVILRGTEERTKGFVRGLRLPVMVIHAMGVMLPVMGLVLFPIVMILMSDKVKPIFLFLGYDLILPVVLWFFIDYILSSRPPTFSQPDVSIIPGIPPVGKFRIGKRDVPILPFILLIVLPLLFFSLSTVWPCIAPVADQIAFCGDATRAQEYVNISLVTTAALGLGIAAYAYLDSLQKNKARADVEKIESEFSTALFQLGNQISGGTPIESAIDKALAKMKGMKIADLFSIVSSNMRRYGYTFEEAVFDEDVGAINQFPSKLIRSLMDAIAQASKRGMKSASNAMVTISNYLKGIHRTKEAISEILGETLSSMKFLAMFLTPIVAGITVTMAVIIIQILSTFGSALGPALAQSEGGASGMMQLGLLQAFVGGGGAPVGPAAFQLVVGIYMIETILILSYFMNRIEYGDDKIGLRNLIAGALMVGVLVYLLSWFMTNAMFGGPLSQLLTPADLVS